MLGLSASVVQNNSSACSGCSLCLLVCPVWRRTRNPRLTPEGRAKALQASASAADLVESIESCTMCGACEPVCPENIDLIGMVLDLRRKLPRPAVLHDLQARMHDSQAGKQSWAMVSARTGIMLMPGPMLRDHAGALKRTRELLECAVGEDDGADIALALEAGVEIPAERLEGFVAPLRELGTIVVADGLLLRYLRPQLPQSALVSLGAALSRVAAVRAKLRATDLYIIEPRAYHANYERLVKYYDALRAEIGCAFNLDLQRIAIPATARSLPQRLGLIAADDSEQVNWILKGRKVERIVVESVEDVATFRKLTTIPVVHLAEVVD